ncbi:MAG: hypothetical protein DWP92_07185 [Armatimonadetes bacterium]|nr:MAG: hypothetical protein DWP92_07185 [Armatimonadota bacterium]
MTERRRRLPAWNTPVLTSVAPVVESARHVTVDTEAIDRVAGWMAYEDFDTPPSGPQFDVRYEDDDLIDWTMLNAALNFAFTDFETAERFDTTYLGKTWADSEAMYACFDRAITEGVPVLDGSWMAMVTRPELNAIFDGTIEIPMLDERVSILNEMGTALVDRYDGRFHTFVRGCEPAMYRDGNGLLERLIAEFPRFNDVSLFDGHEVQIHKLAQLGLWSLHRIGAVPLDDIAAMSAFADYIVPVALRAMGILSYTEELATTIDTRTMIPRDSAEEIELRASSLWATADLTEAVNVLRPDNMQLVIPQVDYRLWRAYHASFAPHHLTRTIMY